MKRMLGFVLVATIDDPPRSPRQTQISALKAAIGFGASGAQLDMFASDHALSALEPASPEVVDTATTAVEERLTFAGEKEQALARIDQALATLRKDTDDEAVGLRGELAEGRRLVKQAASPAEAEAVWRALGPTVKALSERQAAHAAQRYAADPTPSTAAKLNGVPGQLHTLRLASSGAKDPPAKVLTALGLVAANALAGNRFDATDGKGGAVFDGDGWDSPTVRAILARTVERLEAGGQLPAAQPVAGVTASTAPAGLSVSESAAH